MNRTEEKRLVPTSIPYAEGAKKMPHPDGNYYKQIKGSNIADRFQRLKNPDIDKMKSAHDMATNLGPGISDLCMDTFRLLKKDPVKLHSQEGQTQVVKDSLAKKVDVLVRQR